MSAQPDLTPLESRADEVAGLLKILSHRNRLLVACELINGEKSVSALEAATGAPQPHLSRDLARLKREGLVTARKASTSVYYSLADDRLSRVINALCDSYGQPRRRKK